MGPNRGAFLLHTIESRHDYLARRGRVADDVRKARNEFRTEHCRSDCNGAMEPQGVVNRVIDVPAEVAERASSAGGAYGNCGLTVHGPRRCELTAPVKDNGSCYRSHAFADALGENVRHKWTRPYRPQTNGKVERFNRTLAAEWAYAKPYANEAERTAAYETWLHHYNHCESLVGWSGIGWQGWRRSPHLGS